ncbi:MAG: TRAP transporter substrate-binding protein [Clostridiales Family XIII bacterium]|nr:TRAP transporter substrate-binding protein [Clostridiales Family XIII bacterium]
MLALALALALGMSALTACGGGGDSGGDAEAPATEGDAQVPAAEPEYVLNYSSNDPQGSPNDEYVVQPLKKLLEEKSGGRITLEVFYSSSLANMGSCLEGIKNGTVDIGIDVLTMYPGEYMYTELLGTPGIAFGDPAAFATMVAEYMKAFPEKGLDSFKLISRVSSGAFGCLSKKPVSKPGDLKGMTLRASTNFIPWYEAMGGAGTFMPAGDIYESMKLSVIDGAHTSAMGVYDFKLYEVGGYYTFFPMTVGDQVICMSKDLYESMPDDLKAAVDEASEAMVQVTSDYVTEMEAQAQSNILAQNPDFQFVDITDMKGFEDAAAALLDKKAKELDGAGLDGTGALQWLREHAA